MLKGFLALMNARWLKGCTGRNLDILARGPLWQHGIDYKCGSKINIIGLQMETVINVNIKSATFYQINMHNNCSSFMEL